MPPGRYSQWKPLPPPNPTPKECLVRLVDTMRLSILLPWLLLACGTAPGLAADVLTMENGDRLTGEVKSLAGERVFLETAYAGTIQIDWLKLEGFSSDRRFEVEVERGRKYRGKLVLAKGKLEVTTTKETVSVEKDRVVGLAPKAETERGSLWREVEGTLDLGYNLTRGNSQLDQSSFLAQGLYDKGHFKISGDVSSIFGRQDDADPTSRQTAGLRVDWFVNPRVFRFALGTFEHNDRQRLNFRTVLGGGLGRTLLKTKRNELALLGGVTFTGERFRGEPGTSEPPVRRGGEGLAGVEWKTVLRKRIQLSSRLTAHPNLGSSEDYRLAFDGSLRLLFSKNLSWSLTFYDRFVSRPPVQVRRNDSGLVSAFGIGF